MPPIKKITDTTTSRSRAAEHPLVLLPERDIESRQIEARILDVVRTLRRPGVQVELKFVGRSYRHSPGLVVNAPIDEYAQPVDLDDRGGRGVEQLGSG
jgi:hypothetical protein